MCTAVWGPAVDTLSRDRIGQVMRGEVYDPDPLWHTCLQLILKWSGANYNTSSAERTLNHFLKILEIFFPEWDMIHNKNTKLFARNSKRIMGALM